MIRNLTFALLLTTSIAAELPRRGSAGLAVAPSEGAVQIREVFPGRAAETAGLKPGDVIVSLDAEKVETPLDVTSRFGRKKAGQAVKVKYLRDGASHVAELVMTEWPRESSDAYDAAYGEVTADGNRYRTILTTPKGRAAVGTIFLVQGVGCGTIDNPPPGHSYPLLVASLSRRGFATLRVDKPGVGDSEGGPCRDAGYDTEVNAYRAALASLRDRKNVFLFGHSMGGIMAPLIADAHPSLRGIAVYGTTWRSWMTYTVDNMRRQSRMRGESFESIADEEKQVERFNALFYAQQVPMEKILADHPEYREAFPDGTYAGGKAGKYFQQMYAAPAAKAWKASNVPVLAAYGASDFLTDATEHQLVAEAVNSWRPGTARFVQVEGIDHWLRNAATKQVSQQQGPGGGEYNEALAELLVTWATEVLK